MTKPSDIERVNVLDNLICRECVASSCASFTPGHYFCRHTGVFLSVSTPARHRKVAMLVDVPPDDLGLALIDNYGEDGFRALVSTGAHFDA